MLIEIKPDAFAGNDFKALNFLIQLFTYKGHYSFVVDVALAQNKQLYKELHPDDKELIFRSFELAITQQSTANRRTALVDADYYVTQHPTATNERDVTEAIRFFAQPVSIILENSLNDAHFIRKVIDIYDSDGRVTEHLANNWLVFENAGGCTNVKNYIAGKSESFKGLRLNEHHYLRCFVLLDSDRTSPAQAPNHKHQSLESHLNDIGVSLHILEKRTMENYMPDEVIEGYNSDVNANWVGAYRYLTAEQKDFLNIKGGFSKKDGQGHSTNQRNDLSDEVKNLYDDVSDTNFAYLDRGLQIEDFKTDFPKNYVDNPHVNKRTLTARTSHQNDPNELENVFKKIAKMI